MDTEQDNLTDTLKKLARGSRRNKTARLREIFDDVEAAKRAGASNKTIVDALATHGLIFDVNNFKNARSRILKERAIEAMERAFKENPNFGLEPAQEKIREKIVTAAETPAKTRQAKGRSVTESMQATAKSIGKRKSILKPDKGIFGDLDPPAVEGVVDFKQK